MKEFSDKKGLVDEDYKYKSSSSSSGITPMQKISNAAMIFLQLVTLCVVAAILGTAIITLRDKATDECAADQQSVTGSQTGSSYCTNEQLMGYMENITGTVNQLIQETQNTANKTVQCDNSASISAAANNTELLNQVYQTTRNATDMLTNIVSTLSNIQETGISASAAVDDILVVVEQLLELQNGSLLFNSITPVSCQDIKKALPSSPSGYYHVNSRNIYCNMDQLCGSEDGWTRLAYLDMTDSTQDCPTTMDLYTSGSTRACRRSGDVYGSCDSVSFQTNGISYSEVCGRVHAYQYGHTDAISPANQGYGLESHYVDGVSITQGYPRKHIWTLMSGLFENKNSPTDTCPCYPGSTINIPSFVGNDYFCESANPKSYYDLSYYTSDALWDGSGCTTLETDCCTVPNLPWFHKVLANTTSDYIELRLCGNEKPIAEDTPIFYYEIYVK